MTNRATLARDRARARGASEQIEPLERELTFRWPWWMHPIWAVLLLTGTMALVSIAIPDSGYASWRTPKYLVGEQAGMLLLGFAALVAGIMITSSRVLASGSVVVRFNQRQMTFLVRAYRMLLALTFLGYLFWSGSALLQGVSLDAILGVLSREAGAISSLKADSRPIAGLTTFTQVGPIVVVLGIILRRLGLVGRWHYWVVAFSVYRGFFYAERLALLEVVVPALIVIGALTYGSGRRAKFLRVVPLIVAPLALAFFATFEYLRSWVYYEQIVDMPFGEWVSLRLLGYYATSFNNSALLDSLLQSRPMTAPYFTVPFVWNAPIIENLLQPPTIGGQSINGWWSGVLQAYANPEFTNGGSFLLTHGELGTLGMVAYWIVTGAVIGGIYSAMRRGGIVANLAYTCLFVGLLELPRFIYWIQGRAIPLVLALIVLALLYPREEPLILTRKRSGLAARSSLTSTGSWPR